MGVAEIEFQRDSIPKKFQDRQREAGEGHGKTADVP